MKSCHVNSDLEVWPWPSLDRIDLWVLHIFLVWGKFLAKFKRNPSTVEGNMEHTQKVNGQADGQEDGQMNNVMT